MLFNDFKGIKLSRLGFGAMRLPVLENGEIDEKQVDQMIDLSFENGINYFDTAWPYHDGKSEIVIGKSLKRYPRESYYLADKFPGHQIASTYNVEEVFEKQLKKCQVDYFDFYLFHNVYENSIKTYKDDRWKIVDYLIEQKRKGRIKHLGFSTHGSIETIKEFIDYCHGELEFCQIQFNYLDYSLQNAKEKYEMLTRLGLDVWVMEPVRGGKLAKLNDNQEKELKAFRPNDSIASWAFRFIQGFDNVKITLSGMSNLEQMKDNINTYKEYKPLSDKETNLLFKIADELKKSVPCTACKYCMDSCPMKLDIPKLLEIYNELKIYPGVNASMRIECLEENKKPSACLKCGACMKMCPQKIEIPKVLEELNDIYVTLPSWKDISKKREEAAKKL